MLIIFQNLQLNFFIPAISGIRDGNIRIAAFHCGIFEAQIYRPRVFKRQAVKSSKRIKFHRAFIVKKFMFCAEDQFWSDGNQIGNCF